MWRIPLNVSLGLIQDYDQIPQYYFTRGCLAYMCWLVKFFINSKSIDCSETVSTVSRPWCGVHYHFHSTSWTTVSRTLQCMYTLYSSRAFMYVTAMVIAILWSWSQISTSTQTETYSLTFVVFKPRQKKPYNFGFEAKQDKNGFNC